MFVDRLEVSLAELSRKYDEEKEHSRKLREKSPKSKREEQLKKQE